MTYGLTLESAGDLRVPLDGYPGSELCRYPYSFSHCPGQHCRHRQSYPGATYPAHGYAGPEHFSDRCSGIYRSHRPVTDDSLGRPGEAVAQPAAGNSNRAYSSFALADETWNL